MAAYAVTAVLWLDKLPSGAALYATAVRPWRCWPCPVLSGSCCEKMDLHSLSSSPRVLPPRLCPLGTFSGSSSGKRPVQMGKNSTSSSSCALTTTQGPAEHHQRHISNRTRLSRASAGPPRPARLCCLTHVVTASCWHETRELVQQQHRVASTGTASFGWCLLHAHAKGWKRAAASRSPRR
jgi:hypothetical protein